MRSPARCRVFYLLSEPDELGLALARMREILSRPLPRADDVSNQGNFRAAQLVAFMLSQEERPKAAGDGLLQRFGSSAMIDASVFPPRVLRIGGDKPVAASGYRLIGID
jgi:hypothetical protein